MIIYLIIAGCFLSILGLMGFALSSDLFTKFICGGITLVGVGCGIAGLQVSAKKKE